MTQLEQLKQDLANLTERVNCAMALTDGSIYLTREQLKDLIITVQKQTVEYIESEIEDIDLTIDDYIELELDSYNRQIEVNFDSSSFMSDVKHNISGPENEITDEDINSLIEKYK